jgi:DUF4097 and DUF4098 domain-containing protein YvlB
MRTRVTLFSILAAGLALAADSSRYTQDFHYTYPLTSGGGLTLENFNGSVEVTGWERNEVDITGTKYAETPEWLNAIQVEVQASAGSVRIKTVRPEGRLNGGARYVIRVPRRVNLESVSSSNGGVKVAEIEGNVRLNTSNGGVETRNVRGDVEVHTSNGSVRAGSIFGGLAATTSNGSIEAELQSTAASTPIKLATSNGAVRLDLADFRNNDVHAVTSNGPITVRMPAGINARVRAVTSGHNNVSSDFALSAQGTLSKSQIEGTIGGGGPLLDLRTSNGPISLTRR